MEEVFGNERVMKVVCVGHLQFRRVSGIERDYEDTKSRYLEGVKSKAILNIGKLGIR